MYKFHNDPTVKESVIVVLLGQVWAYAKKEKVLQEEGETSLRKKEEV